MKHVCVDVRSIHSYGVGSYLKSLLEGLSKKAHLTFLHAPQDAAFLERYHPIQLISLQSPSFSVREQFELPRKIPPCDLFWSPMINVPLAPIRASARLTAIHDTYHLTCAPSVRAHLLYNAAAALADHVTTLTTFSAGEIKRRIRLQPKTLSILPPVLSKQFRPIADHEAVRQKYRLPERFLLTAGSGKPHKNLDRLRKAVPERIPLVIAGTGALGYVPDEELPALYSAATAFVFPSLYEGFGLPPLEAMACGCPVIVSDAASLPEVCESAAEYVNPLDIESIRQGVERVFDSPERQQELREQGIARAATFSPEATWKQLEEIIDACCRHS